MNRSEPGVVRFTPQTWWQLAAVAEKRGVTVAELMEASVRSLLAPASMARAERDAAIPQLRGATSGWKRRTTVTDGDKSVIMRLTLQGVRASEIARGLGLSRETVRKYRRLLGFVSVGPRVEGHWERKAS